MKKQFYIGQNLLWITEDFEGRHVTKAVVTENNSYHAIARTADNGNGSDELNLWIDESTEMGFYDADFLKRF